MNKPSSPDPKRAGGPDFWGPGSSVKRHPQEGAQGAESAHVTTLVPGPQPCAHPRGRREGQTLRKKRNHESFLGSILEAKGLGSWPEEEGDSGLPRPLGRSPRGPPGWLRDPDSLNPSQLPCVEEEVV